MKSDDKNKSENLIYRYVTNSKSAYKRAVAMSEVNYYAVLLRITHDAATTDDHMMAAMYEVTHVGFTSSALGRRAWMRAYEEKLNDAR